MFLLRLIARRHVRAVLALTACLTLGTAARAEPVQLTYDGHGAGIFSSIRLDGVDQSVYIGQFNMHLSTGPNFSDSGPSFISFCVDLEHNLHLGQQYLVAMRSSGDGLTNGDEIAYLYDRYGQSALDNDHAAGLQLAIWELVSGGDGDLHTGRFQYLQDDAAAADALAYLAEAAGAIGLSGWLDASPSGDAVDRGQSVLLPPDLLPHDVPPPPTQEVPEPTSLLCVGLALTGLVAQRRFRRSGARAG
jgi:hypothetical protein